MAKMRAMQHNSRTNSGGKTHGTLHNDRNFDTSKADNIHPERAQDNVYSTCYPGEDLTFEQVELKFYTEHFSQQLSQTNEAYLRNGHPERCKDMEAWKAIKRNAPEETVLQVGTMEDHITREQLRACYQDYAAWLESWNADHGHPFTVLTTALHADEVGAPHIHTRRVWHYEEKNGVLRIGQEKALEAAGVPLPHPDEAPSKRNNRKMTFDAMTREKWLDVLREHSLDIERIAVPDGRHNRDKEAMIRDKYSEMILESGKAQERLEAAHVALTAAEAERASIGSEVEKLNQAAVEASQKLSEVTTATQEAEQELGRVNATLDAVRPSEPLPEGKKTITGQIKLPKNDFDTLVKAASVARAAKSDADQLRSENERLSKENDSLRKQIPSSLQRFLDEAKLNHLEERMASLENAIYRVVASLWRQLVEPFRQQRPTVWLFKQVQPYWTRDQKLLFQGARETVDLGRDLAGGEHKLLDKILEQLRYPREQREAAQEQIRPQFRERDFYRGR